MPDVDVLSVTGFIAFQIRIGRAEDTLVLNLPLDDAPEGREAAVLRTVINNVDGFIRYLLMLVGGLDSVTILGPGGTSEIERIFSRIVRGDSALLEELVIALSRDPDRLQDVSSLVKDLCESEETKEVFPEGFLEFWSVFEETMEKVTE